MSKPPCSENSGDRREMIEILEELPGGTELLDWLDGESQACRSYAGMASLVETFYQLKTSAFSVTGAIHGYVARFL